MSLQFLGSLQGLSFVLKFDRSMGSRTGQNQFIDHLGSYLSELHGDTSSETPLIYMALLNSPHFTKIFQVLDPVDIPIAWMVIC